MPDWLGKIRRQGLGAEEERAVRAEASGSPSGGDAEFLARLAAAHQEWLAAQRFFAEVRELDLVDEAVHRLQASERHYMYLLKEARRQGLEAPVRLRLDG